MKERSNARFSAVQALYTLEAGGDSVDNVLRHANWSDGGNPPKRDEELFRDTVAGVSNDKEALDALIRPVLLTDWHLERLDAVLRAILRAATYELQTMRDIPPKVTVHEYVTVTRKFFEQGQEITLANGILDKIAHSIRPDEM